ncbi:AtpZ/AtpI family protein [Actinoplanes sp. TFC3]|uniref:AtpZ/AtpI family protein n=1 Tax=Actinoplanes sp. TFC3 TaxID=1710355 RepID=UPI00082AB456|nr:AtpZ/AtpI family protein [Actinoplanes sp. TFC3]
MADEQPPQKKPQPTGDQSAWAALSTLLSGIVVWGGLGYLVDLWLDLPNRLGLLVGMIVGLAASLYLVIKRFG